jgi:hypothetical protein
VRKLCWSDERGLLDACELCSSRVAWICSEGRDVGMKEVQGGFIKA